MNMPPKKIHRISLRFTDQARNELLDIQKQVSDKLGCAVSTNALCDAFFAHVRINKKFKKEFIKRMTAILCPHRSNNTNFDSAVCHVKPCFLNNGFDKRK